MRAASSGAFDAAMVVVAVAVAAAAAEEVVVVVVVEVSNGSWLVAERVLADVDVDSVGKDTTAAAAAAAAVVDSGMVDGGCMAIGVHRC